MYLSKVEFSRHPDFMRGEDVVKTHKFVMSLFPDKLSKEEPRSKGAILYRADKKTDGQVSLLVQSNIEPSMDNVKSISTRNILDLKTKDITSIYNQILSHEEISYKIKANPIKTQNGKRIPIRGEADIEAWWLNKLLAIGLQPINGMTSVALESTTTGDGNGKNAKVIINSADISGRARVTDRRKVLDTINLGMGKSKSYGFGLLLLGS